MRFFVIYSDWDTGSEYKYISEVCYMNNKLKLYGFNNLTKSLSFNIYDVCYARTPKAQLDYIAYVDEAYNSKRITEIMTHLTEMIGAQVLSVSAAGLRSAGSFRYLSYRGRHNDPRRGK